MVSYKQLYEKQLAFNNSTCSTGFNCPLCSAEIIFKGQEFICKNENCSYDKLAIEVFQEYAEYFKNYEKVK